MKAPSPLRLKGRFLAFRALFSYPTPPAYISAILSHAVASAEVGSCLLDTGARRDTRRGIFYRILTVFLSRGYLVGAGKKKDLQKSL